MTVAKLLAFVIFGVIGVVLMHLAKSDRKPTSEAYLWLIGTGWLAGAAVALYSWEAS